MKPTYVDSWEDDDERPFPAYSPAEPDNLADIFEAGLEPIYPDLLWRRDAHALLYKKKLNVIFGAPEAGKTWIAIIAACEQTALGNTIIVLDYEDDARSYLTRMQQAGADMDLAIEHSYHYTLNQPIDTLNENLHGLNQAELVIVDTTNSAMVLQDLDPLSNKDALKFINDIRALRIHTDAAWLLLDHEPISTGNGRRQAIGAQSKLGAVDGAQYRAIAVQQPRPGAKGAIALYLTKDRAGGVRRSAGEPDEHGIQHAATVMLDPNQFNKDRFEWAIIEPQGTDKDQILRTAIMKATTTPTSKTQIKELVRSQGLQRRDSAITETVEVMTAEGLLTARPRGNYLTYEQPLPDPGRPPLPENGPTKTPEHLQTPY